MTVNWRNPYAAQTGKWYKGNLHTHTSPASHCGKVPVPRMLGYYAKAGYDFFAVTDMFCVWFYGQRGFLGQCGIADGVEFLCVVWIPHKTFKKSVSINLIFLITINNVEGVCFRIE